MRAIALAALASLTIALAACGSGDVGAGAPPSSAALLKPGAVAYAQVVTDSDFGQWQQAQDLISRFPSGDALFARLEAELAKEGVSWEDDVKPALGSVLDVVVYPDGGGGPSIVGLTNQPDKAAFDALDAKVKGPNSEHEYASRDLGDWIAISNSQAAIDNALKNGGESLADAQSFKDAMADLPADALARVYVDPGRAVALAGDSSQKNAFELLGFDKLDFAGAWAKARDEGAELGFSVRGDGAEALFGAEPYTSKLLDRIPADAFAVATFRADGLKRSLDRYRQNPMFEKAVSEFEQEYGVTLDELAGLLDGEAVLAVGKGAPIPEITLLLETDDPAAARATVDRLLRKAGPELGNVQLTTGTLDGALIVSTGRNAVAELQERGDKLVDSDRYKDALDHAGAPDEYTGLLYVDLREATDLILGFAGVSGAKIPPKVAANLEPLKSLVVYGTLDGSLATSQAFVEID
jgi:hypothetical protein